MKRVLYGIAGNAALGVMRKPASARKTKYRKINNAPLHRVMVEHRIGMKLPARAVVHHVDPADKLTNKGPLVVCENQAYHALLEIRGRALRACGNANWLRCGKCGEYDDPKNLIITPFRSAKRMRVTHRELGDECVDMDAPRPPGAEHCHASPHGRHSIAAKKAPWKRPGRVYERSGLEQRCAHCRALIRRAHEKSTRWFAIVGTQLSERGNAS